MQNNPDRTPDQTWSLPLLEFSALKELLARYVYSELGHAELKDVAPLSNRTQMETAAAEVAESLEYVRSSFQPQPAARGSAIRVRFDSIPPILNSISRLRIEGAALEARQIFELTSFLDQAGEIRSVLNTAADRFPRLGALSGEIADLRFLVRDLRGKILPDGSLADDASVALNRLRRDIEKQQRHVQISLERFMRAHRDDGTLQEDFVTIRDNRFVVPVVTGQQRKVNGVIHGVSGTGHTLFVEPLETIHLNNELVRLRDEEQQEVQRILRELTGLLRAHATAVAVSAAAIGRLELLFAKANFGADFTCVVARFSPPGDRKIILKSARHPLLEDVLRRQKKRVVPVSLNLDEQCRTLLISGPNTGGKTVSLKTVGLLALMAHSGIPVPADEAEFPVFDQILADMGDQQSIAESLSTFSAHIAHVREMLELVTHESLVLLDELGRATDPEEGGALGVAVLDKFRTYGSFTLASTHLLALKMYGATTPGVLNASMGFDDETLQPTYILRLGAPGKSAGLEIAGRLGLPVEMIERARSTMSHQERDLSRFLGELHERLDRLSAAEANLQEQQAALEARERALTRESEQRERAKLREIEERYEAAVASFEATARETIDRIRESAETRKAADNAQRQLSKTRREFEQQVRTDVLGSSPTAPPPLVLEEGARVRLKGIREPARVRRLLSGDRIEVEAGLLKMQVSIDEVEQVLPPAPATAKLPANVRYESGPTWDVSYREINIIGQRAEEAREAVDKFLDSASLASVDRVRIVHGFGMGILRKMVADLLSHHPNVAKFYAATPAEGGGGATIVELK